MEQAEGAVVYVEEGDDRLFAACIGQSQGFSCGPLRRNDLLRNSSDPALSYDLRKGHLKMAGKLYSLLADKVRGTKEYVGGCSLVKQEKLPLVPVYGYLEHGDFQKK